MDMLNPVNQDEVKFFSQNSRHELKKKNYLCGFRKQGFWHSAKNWRPLQDDQMHILMDHHPFRCFTERSARLSLESGCFCGRFCLNILCLDLADSWVTQWPKLKAGRRCCLNGGTLGQMFFSVETSIKSAHISAATRWRDLDCCSTSVTVVMITLECFEGHKGRCIFFPKVGLHLLINLLKKLKTPKMPWKRRQFSLKHIGGGFVFLNGARWKMNCGVASSSSRFFSRETPRSMTPTLSKWSSMNHIISDKCVFCLPVMLTPPMTINAEYALYSTFYFIFIFLNFF